MLEVLRHIAVGSVLFHLYLDFLVISTIIACILVTVLYPGYSYIYNPLLLASHTSISTVCVPLFNGGGVYVLRETREASSILHADQNI